MKKLTILLLSAIFFINNGIVFAADITPDKTLESYFNTKQIKEMQNYKSAFAKISSVKELSATYKKSRVLASSLTNKINNIENPDLNKYIWMNKYVPGLELHYGAEGMSIYFDTNFKEYLNKAKKTPGTSDDTFLSLMIDSFGDSGDAYPKWFMMTWDLGGYTLLGKGTHIKMLEKINVAMTKSPDFREEIKEVRERLFNDILNGNNFAVPKSSIIKEINQIINNKSINNKEKIKLQNRIKELNKPSKALQFNCEKVDCAYG